MSIKGVSTWGAALTFTRLCIGSGILALPFASTRGGLLFSPLGLIFVAIWNGIACLQMIACRNRTATVVVPKEVSSSFSKIAFCGLGWSGVFLTDFSIFITLIGVCISNQINIATLMHDIVGDVISVTNLIFLSAVLVYPLACSRNVSTLAKFSPVGMFCLLLNVLTIFGYGLVLYGDKMFDVNIPLWPESVADLTSYSGVAIFCFGICGLAFPVEESMTDPAKFPEAVFKCLVLVCSIYFVVGDGVALLYSHSSTGIFGNVLLNLPHAGVIAIFSRLAMVSACVLYYPLAFLPPANILERSLMNHVNRFLGADTLSDDDSTSRGDAAKTDAGAVPSDRDRDSRVVLENSRLLPSDGSGQAAGQTYTEAAPDLEALPQPLPSTTTRRQGPRRKSKPRFQEPPYWFMCLSRLLLVVGSTAVATLVPCFSSIVTLLGCFAVSLLSFVLPPLLHLILVAGPNYRGEASVDQAQYEAVWSANLELTSSDPDVVSANGDSATLFVSIVVYLKSAKCIYYCDWILLVGGVFMTSVGTYITAVDVAARLARGIC